MAFGQEKIKEFFEEEKEKITRKIERTPMEKFFVFFLILITIFSLVLGYLQFKKNIEEPLAESYLQQARGQILEKYGFINFNANTNQYVPISIFGTEEILNTEINTNAEAINQELLESDITSSLGDLDSNTLLNIESQLLSGQITLKDLGIDDPELQKVFDQIRSGQAANLNQLSQEEKDAALGALKSLTPQQIRDELVKRGIPKEQLDNIDDQTLQNLLLETINSADINSLEINSP